MHSRKNLKMLILSSICLSMSLLLTHSRHCESYVFSISNRLTSCRPGSRCYLVSLGSVASTTGQERKVQIICWSWISLNSWFPIKKSRNDFALKGSKIKSYPTESELKAITCQLRHNNTSQYLFFSQQWTPSRLINRETSNEPSLSSIPHFLDDNELETKPISNQAPLKVYKRGQQIKVFSTISFERV